MDQNIDRDAETNSVLSRLQAGIAENHKKVGSITQETLNEGNKNTYDIYAFITDPKRSPLLGVGGEIVVNNPDGSKYVLTYVLRQNIEEGKNEIRLPASPEKKQRELPAYMKKVIDVITAGTERISSRFPIIGAKYGPLGPKPNESGFSPNLGVGLMPVHITEAGFIPVTNEELAILNSDTKATDPLPNRNIYQDPKAVDAALGLDQPNKMVDTNETMHQAHPTIMLPETNSIAADTTVLAESMIPTNDSPPTRDLSKFPGETVRLPEAHSKSPDTTVLSGSNIPDIPGAKETTLLPNLELRSSAEFTKSEARANEIRQIQNNNFGNGEPTKPLGALPAEGAISEPGVELYDTQDPHNSEKMGPFSQFEEIDRRMKERQARAIESGMNDPSVYMPILEARKTKEEEEKEKKRIEEELRLKQEEDQRRIEQEINEAQQKRAFCCAVLIPVVIGGACAICNIGAALINNGGNNSENNTPPPTKTAEPFPNDGPLPPVTPSLDPIPTTTPTPFESPSASSNPTAETSSEFLAPEKDTLNAGETIWKNTFKHSIDYIEAKTGESYYKKDEKGNFVLDYKKRRVVANKDLVDEVNKITDTVTGLTLSLIPTDATGAFNLSAGLNYEVPSMKTIKQIDKIINSSDLSQAPEDIQKAKLDIDILSQTEYLDPKNSANHSRSAAAAKELEIIFNNLTKEDTLFLDSQ